MDVFKVSALVTVLKRPNSAVLRDKELPSKSSALLARLVLFLSITGFREYSVLTSLRQPLMVM